MTTPTDPLDGVVMPYSATFYPRAGYGTMHIVEAHRNTSSEYRLALPSGVSTVTVTANGPLGVRMWHEQTGQNNVLVAEIPERSGGGGVRDGVHCHSRRRNENLPRHAPSPDGSGHSGGVPRGRGRHAHRHSTLTAAGVV